MSDVLLWSAVAVLIIFPVGGAAMAFWIDRKDKRAMEEKRQTPSLWEKDFGVKVTDPDGWRNAGVPWSRELTRAEFNLLCAESTINRRPNG